MTVEIARVDLLKRLCDASGGKKKRRKGNMERKNARIPREYRWRQKLLNSYFPLFCHCY